MGTARRVISATLEGGALEGVDARVQSVRGRERLGELFGYDVTLVTRDVLDVDALVGSEVTLSFSVDGEHARSVHGMLATVEESFDAGALATYRVRLVPRAFRSTLVDTYDLFLDLSVPEIILKKLALVGLEGDDVVMRLGASYPKRELVVQYRETDLAFVSRLVEHLGVTLFFEHDAGRDVLVLTDEPSGFRPLEGLAECAYRGRGETSDVYALASRARVIPSAYVVRDYNYRKPSLDLTAMAEAKAGHAGGVYEYGAHYKSPEEGERLAKIRAEEAEATRRLLEGKSDLLGMAAGGTTKLEGHPRYDGEVLIVELELELDLPVFDDGERGGRGGEAVVRFVALPRAVPFRPARVTPKPRVHGSITGIVDNTKSAGKPDDYATVDDEGRYTVRFLFDTNEPGERPSSRPVRMAQPHAGAGYGMHFPLRPGVEVLLTCIDGDPDRPIIAGTVPNPQTASPIAAQNHKRNVIRTGGQNQIELDDDDGNQRIKLTTPRSNTTLQMGSPNAPEDGIFMQTLGNTSQLASGVASSASTANNVLTSMLSTFGNHIAVVAGKQTLGGLASGAIDGLKGGMSILSTMLGDTLSTGKGLLSDTGAFVKTSAEMVMTLDAAQREAIFALVDLAQGAGDVVQGVLQAGANEGAAHLEPEQQNLVLEVQKASNEYGDAARELDGSTRALSDARAKQAELRAKGDSAGADAMQAEIAALEADVAADQAEVAAKKQALDDAIAAVEEDDELASMPELQKAVVSIKDARASYESAYATMQACAAAKASLEESLGAGALAGAAEVKSAVDGIVEQANAVLGLGVGTVEGLASTALGAVDAGKGLLDGTMSTAGGLVSGVFLMKGSSLETYATNIAKLMQMEAAAQRDANLPTRVAFQVGVTGKLAALTGPVTGAAGKLSGMDLGTDVMMATSKMSGPPRTNLVFGVTSRLEWEPKQLVAGTGTGGMALIKSQVNRLGAGTVVGNAFNESRHILGSEQHVLVWGKESAFLHGHRDTTVSSAEKVQITADEQVVLHSRGKAEVAGGEAVMLTSTLLVDILSRTAVSIAATDKTGLKDTEKDKKIAVLDMKGVPGAPELALAVNDSSAKMLATLLLKGSAAGGTATLKLADDTKIALTLDATAKTAELTSGATSLLSLGAAEAKLDGSTLTVGSKATAIALGSSAAAVTLSASTLTVGSSAATINLGGGSSVVTVAGSQVLLG